MLHALLVALAVSAPGGDEAVHFAKGSFSEVADKAAAAKLPMFVDFYTDWCVWCKRLDANVYPNPAVAEVLNTKFVPYKIDAEKGEGPKLNEQYKVSGYPTMVIIDPTTKEEIDRIVGYAEPDAFRKTLDQIASGDNFAGLKKRTASNPNDLEAWSMLADKLLQREDLDGAKAALGKVVALDASDEKGKKSHAELQLAMIAAQTSGDIKPLIEVAKRYDGKPAALEAHTFLAMNLGGADEPEMTKQASTSFDYLLSHGKRDAQVLNGYAWLLATHSQSLDKALAMANEAAKLEPKSAAILDTVAECLFRMGKKDEAIATAKRVLELATSDAEKKQFQARLDGFQKGVSTADEKDGDGDEDEDDGDDGF
jgi:thioredoxin-related protein/Tfp pilus assembly protein PilF